MMGVSEDGDAGVSDPAVPAMDKAILSVNKEPWTSEDTGSKLSNTSIYLYCRNKEEHMVGLFTVNRIMMTKCTQFNDESSLCLYIFGHFEECSNFSLEAHSQKAFFALVSFNGLSRHTHPSALHQIADVLSLYYNTKFISHESTNNKRTCFYCCLFLWPACLHVYLVGLLELFCGCQSAPQLHTDLLSHVEVQGVTCCSLYQKHSGIAAATAVHYKGDKVSHRI